MGTGLAVVNSNLPLSPRRGGERAAEVGLGFHGWAPRPRRARGKGMARAGARGPPRARRGSSTCGARDRECVRWWGSRARGVCVCGGGGRSAAAQGERTCAQAPRAALCVGPEMARSPRRSQSSRPTNEDRGHAPIQKGGVGLLPPGAVLDPEGDPGRVLGTLAHPAKTLGETGLEFLLREEWGEGEPAGIPELLPRSSFGHRERSLPQIKNSSVILLGYEVVPKGSIVLPSEGLYSCVSPLVVRAFCQTEVWSLRLKPVASNRGGTR